MICWRTISLRNRCPFIPLLVLQLSDIKGPVVNNQFGRKVISSRLAPDDLPKPSGQLEFKFMRALPSVGKKVLPARKLVGDLVIRRQRKGANPDVHSPVPFDVITLTFPGWTLFLRIAVKNLCLPLDGLEL